ncbi:MAG: hypothetical protein KGN76_12580 [Acidobacteriota bacterium]|nr:hypothetical protein [Acidobacteriota bacterium]
MIGLLLVAGLTAAAPSPRPVAAAQASSPDRLQRTIAIDPSTPITIDITEGAVDITGTTGHDLVVDMVRRVGRGKDRSRLPMQIEGTAAGVHISAVQTDEGKDPDLQTVVKIQAPPQARFTSIQVFEGQIHLQNLHGVVTADIMRGPIVGTGVSGTLRLVGHVGDVTLTDARLTDGGLLRLRTFNGNVTLGLAESPPNARVLAVTFRGALTSTLPLHFKDKFGPRFGEASIGRGQPLISIDVVYGDIRITVPH